MKVLAFLTSFIFAASIISQSAYAACPDGHPPRSTYNLKNETKRYTDAQVVFLTGAIVAALVITRRQALKSAPVVIPLVTRGAKLLRKTGGRTTIYTKKGGYKKALADFNAAKPADVKSIPNGMTGKLKDGNITVRSTSKSGEPTLSITGKTRATVKIRYK